MNRRVFIERKDGFDIERKELIRTIDSNFNLYLPSIRYYLIYDIFNISETLIQQSIEEILTEKNRDFALYSLVPAKNTIAIEFLPGQFDQRADSAEQCIKLVAPESKPIIKSGIAILFDEDISEIEMIQIKKFLINSVEAREKNLSEISLVDTQKPEDIPILNGFTSLELDDLSVFYKSYGLAMSIDDLIYVQEYFKNDENRDPYETELRVLDTYWSDHCRHTTFETEIMDVVFDESFISKKIEESFISYLQSKEVLCRDKKPTTLMDLATINARVEKQNNNLNDIEISEEVNAASIYIDVDVDGVDEKWLLMFKNETHNHPTEIEPFGGASTCIGGAIRDPLSGRSYVYSAMRVTGASNITADIKDTLFGKLPQSVISKESAHGYSSYGNQIGLATTFIDEIYHPGYQAKRMEIGAVVGAVKAEHVRRETPESGDVILLLGGKTGRDGVGGATGSSKEHTVESLDLSSAEVQKGNAPEERKIQRLFRNREVTRLIKKSNDFGAGGVSVAIGELADGLIINLDNVPVKYMGINGTELAISESQERMAVVIEPCKVALFKSFCEKENIEVSNVATVTDSKRLVMNWRGKVICDMSRDFIDSAGVRQSIDIRVPKTEKTNIFKKEYEGKTIKKQLLNMLQDENIASNQGLVEMFDSSIGRTTVLSPFGGQYKLTKSQVSVHKLPVQNKKTNTVSMMAYGFNPYVSEWSPYHGATFAVVESMAKIVSAGGTYESIRFTFQEYFERLNNNSLLWSKPFSALLGAYATLKEFGLAAIGGKDSMSGTYHDLTVPPTLVSFAVCTDKVQNIISPEFKSAGNYIYLVDYNLSEELLPDFNSLKQNFSFVRKNIYNKNIVSAYSLSYGGVLEAITKMSFGNKVGVELSTDYSLFDLKYGAILIESNVAFDQKNVVYLGKTIGEPSLNVNNEQISIERALEANQKRYKTLYPVTHNDKRVIPNFASSTKMKTFKRDKQKEVKVVIPVFPGTNCEYDCETAFMNEGAVVEIIVFNNQSEQSINKSLKELADAIDNSHILMLAGGFSSGDEPDGSGKFIATVLKNEIIAAAIDRFIKKKNLILGICNGFQALVKSGLLPSGNIRPIENNDPTLFKNSINRHIAKFVNTKVSSTNSPWLSSFNLNDVHTIAMSHGEGNFTIDEDGYKSLLDNNQIAFQYVDNQGVPTYNPLHNPNGSSYAIEGIISEDGLILGKMGHSERYTDDLFINIHGNKIQNIFKNGVEYIKRGSIK